MSLGRTNNLRTSINILRETKPLLRQASEKMQRDKGLINPPFLYEVMHWLVKDFLQEDCKEN